jgi:triosephosphate isomerase
VADVLRVLYGGGVKPYNVKGLRRRATSAALGEASLKADPFLKLVFYDKQ